MAFEREQTYLDTLSDEYIADVIAINQRELTSPDNDKPWVHEARLEVFIPEAIKRGIAVTALTSVEVS